MPSQVSGLQKLFDSSGTLQTQLQLRVAEKSGWSMPEISDDDPLGKFANQMSETAMANMSDIPK